MKLLRRKLWEVLNTSDLLKDELGNGLHVGTGLGLEPNYLVMNMGDLTGKSYDTGASVNETWPVVVQVFHTDPDKLAEILEHIESLFEALSATALPTSDTIMGVYADSESIFLDPDGPDDKGKEVWQGALGMTFEVHRTR